MLDIVIIDKNFFLSDLKKLAAQRFGDMVKVVIDVEKKIIALGAELHADEEALLLERGSNQENLWGINIYIDQPIPVKAIFRETSKIPISKIKLKR